MAGFARPRIIRHAEVDSTNERAFAALAAGTARDGDVHVARSQTAGRGRLGRRWVSPPDEGLFASFVHLPAGNPGARLTAAHCEAPSLPAPALTIAAGLAVLDALGEVGLRDTRLKWPNDVVVGSIEESREGGGPKLAGILVEARSLDPGAPRYVIGVGINVRQRTFPAQLEQERPVTSLALQGLDLAPDDLLAPLARAMETRLAQARDAPSHLTLAFLGATRLADRDVRVRTAAGEVVGRLRSIDLWQGLTVETGAATARIELAHVHAVDPTAV